ISIVHALEELGSASWLAPWWAEPYREIAGLKERSGEIEGAILGLKLCLLAAPTGPDREGVRLKLRELSRMRNSKDPKASPR
ncbi:MAG TPA: hypothetical protein VEY91_11135, partial [Candidatus Limnocylindria bacterium]|nr:hypothetical protein [Candidatus Limnocylindria bacterium]